MKNITKLKNRLINKIWVDETSDDGEEFYDTYIIKKSDFNNIFEEALQTEITHKKEE